MRETLAVAGDNASVYAELASDSGRALLAQLAEFTEAQRVAATAFARKAAGPRLAAAALATAFARRRAHRAGKFTRADQMFFTHPGYEQSSSEAVARHRAERFTRCRSVVDLCCGIGSDSIAIASAPGDRHVVGVDLDADALVCAALNARAYGVADSAQFYSGDALRWPLDVDAAFADPSRRGAQGRVKRATSYNPPLDAVLERAREVKGRALAVKIAPGLPIEADGLQAQCGAPVELEYVSEHGECKEAVIWCGEFARRHGAVRASVIDAQGTHVLDGSVQRADVGTLGPWLGEPDPAVIRAGLIGALCERIGATIVDPNVAYVTSSDPISSPFTRWFEIAESIPFGVKRLRAAMRARDIGPLIIKTRAFPMRPDEIAALLKLRGSKRGLLICSTIRGTKTALICVPPTQADDACSVR